MPKSAEKKIKITVSLYPTIHECLLDEAARMRLSATQYAAGLAESNLNIGVAFTEPKVRVEQPPEYLRKDGVRVSVFLERPTAKALDRFQWRKGRRPSNAQILARWITDHFHAAAPESGVSPSPRRRLQASRAAKYNGVNERC